MTSTARRLFACVLLAAAMCLAAGTSPAFAQGGATSSLSGTVTDASGAVVPGANVVVKRMDTGITSEAITNGEGQIGRAHV